MLNCSPKWVLFGPQKVASVTITYEISLTNLKKKKKKTNLKLKIAHYMYY